MTTPAAIEVRIVLAVICAAVVAIFANNVIAWHDKAQTADKQAATLRATSGVIADGAEADAHQNQVQHDVGQARAAYNDNKQEAYSNEPDLRARADRVFPVVLRNLARERRLSRERSGCAGSQRETECAAHNASER